MEKRYTLLLLTTILLLIVWIVQLFSVHLLDPHNLSGQISLRQNPSKRIINPKRGNIFTSDRQLLVGSVIHYQADLDLISLRNHCQRNAVNYSALSDSLSVIMSKYTGASASRIKQRLTSKKKSVMIDNDISERNILQLKAAFFQRKIPGLVVSFSKIERTYPKGKLAS
ncbi:MAG: hypothetical protein R6U84_04665, partial [Candidatus Cloacimonadales bacterium]